MCVCDGKDTDEFTHGIGNRCHFSSIESVHLHERVVLDAQCGREKNEIM